MTFSLLVVLLTSAGLRSGTVQTAGSEFAKLLKDQGLFGDQAKKRLESKARVAEKLTDLVATYHGVINW